MKPYIYAAIFLAFLFNAAFAYFENKQDYTAWGTAHIQVGALPERIMARGNVSRGDFVREVPIGEFELTAYCLTGKMANGDYVHDGAVAVDPNVIPLGAKLRIEGMKGIYVACDTGEVIKGKKLDIWLKTELTCDTFGRQHRQVWIIE